MSITPQFMEELRSRVPISEVVGRFVTWDTSKSRMAQGDYWAPCPFHMEKTASFHADDRKGFFYCFGCHEKGDSIAFLRKKANLDFIDAVREIANMAGMEVPKASPQEREKADANARLVEMHEQAARFYSRQLQSSAGTIARDYLLKDRGLSQEIIQEFGIGYIPNARDMLLQDLREAGFKDEEILTAGLALKPDDGGANFDRFRNRIMFPIHDGRGRVIAFGGRAMDANAKAKYLNSADSPIFHKGKVVYNLHRARAHMGEDNIVLAEGYMDVIALAQAGIKTAVAPLGTAITLDQLGVVWRLDRAPILALDGDEAGQKAALRIAHLALPRIAPERTLNFALMPQGQDPDDLIKSKGTKAMRELLTLALPLVDILWQEALSVEPLETPEARASFDAKLKALVGQMEDASLKSHYLADFRERRKALWQSNSSNGAKSKNFIKPQARNTQIFKPQAHQDFRVALILRTILNYPELAQRFTDDLSQLKCPNAELDRLRKEVIMAYGDENALKLIATKENLDKLSFGTILRQFKIFGEDQNSDRALDISTDDIARVTVQSRAREEIDSIFRDIQSQELNEDMEALLKSAVIMRDEARKILDDQMEDDEDSRAFLRQFLESERWRK